MPFVVEVDGEGSAAVFCLSFESEDVSFLLVEEEISFDDSDAVAAITRAVLMAVSVGDVSFVDEVLGCGVESDELLWLCRVAGDELDCIASSVF